MVLRKMHCDSLGDFIYLYLFICLFFTLNNFFANKVNNLEEMDRFLEINNFHKKENMDTGMLSHTA